MHISVALAGDTTLPRLNCLDGVWLGGGRSSGFPALVEKEHPSLKTSSSGGGGTLSPLDQSSSPTAPVTIRSRRGGRGVGAGPYASCRANVVSPTGSHVPNPTAPLSRVGAVCAHPLSLCDQWLLFLGPVAAPPTPKWEQAQPVCGAGQGGPREFQKLPL